MATHDYSLANASGAAFRSDLNDALAAIVTWNSGTSWATTFARQRVVDTATGVIKRRNAANGGWIFESTDDETLVVSRSSNTILDESDIGKTFVATSTFTQTLTAAATLTGAWWCRYRNDGTGSITIDPNGAETIDGSATLVLPPRASIIIICDGTNFKTLGNSFSGTSTNDSAAAGNIGEYMETAVAAAAAVSLTTATGADIATVALTAGDWDVEGVVAYSGNGATTVAYMIASISTVSATPANPEVGGYAALFGNGELVFGTLSAPGFSLSRRRISVSGTTTVYLTTFCGFAASTMKAYGIISARRVR